MCLSVFILFMVISSTYAETKCDQRPIKLAYDMPSENEFFNMTLTTKGSDTGAQTYRPDQTYVLTIKSTNETTNRTFRWFMITAEDPNVDNIDYQGEPADVGSLKSLDGRQSRYSERCKNTVENTDNTEKTSVEVHWVSPKPSAETNKVRIRATIGENDETWYAGPKLTIELSKDVQRGKDSPPTEPRTFCNLCSEAQYEIIFHGRWSRLTHPQHYPIKPDENGYSHLIGASHALDYTLWKDGEKANEGIKDVAEKANITTIERHIINNMELEKGTRTLIRGKKRHHPHMSKPSHSLLRVDRFHHLFSIIVALRPSPDWFLGVSRFELCTENGWLDYYKMPLYPWDAGTMDGISYESVPAMTQPEKHIERVAVGSFDRESPFFQLNLNDLHPFAYLEIRRLQVYPLINVPCATQNMEEPNVAELVIHPFESAQEASNQKAYDESISEIEVEGDCTSAWSDWTPCVPIDGTCGPGIQSRNKYSNEKNSYYEISDKNRACQKTEETQRCYVNCI